MPTTLMCLNINNGRKKYQQCFNLKAFSQALLTTANMQPQNKKVQSVFTVMDY